MIEIKVIRKRHTATDGTVTVHLNGSELATYRDDIRLTDGAGPCYGEIVDGYASVVPDEDYMFDAVFNVPNKAVC